MALHCGSALTKAANRLGAQVDYKMVSTKSIVIYSKILQGLILAAVAYEVFRGTIGVSHFVTIYKLTVHNVAAAEQVGHHLINAVSGYAGIVRIAKILNKELSPHGTKEASPPEAHTRSIQPGIN